MNDNQPLSELLRDHVEHLATTIGPRSFRVPGSIERTIEYIEGAWKSLGYEVQREVYDALGDQATNLIVEWPGTSKSDEIILLGAHYDTVTTTPGADDNGSAVAVLLEVSRLLKGIQPSRTIRFVAFACEEPPYFNMRAMGSEYHARQCKARGDDIKAMLCLEMVVFFSDEEYSQGLPEGLPEAFYQMIPDRGNFLAAVGNMASESLVTSFEIAFRDATSLPLLPVALPESILEIQLSDNRSFWNEGYPALMLTDTSFLRNPHYHRATDLPETLDYDRMGQVALGVEASMRFLAG
ncbi:zinc-binding metallopeptidase family protein [Lacunimicrobium album]